MKLLRKIVKFILLILHIFLGIILSFILFLPGLARYLSPNVSMRVVVWWSYVLCRICGLSIRQHGKWIDSPAIFVANHISWLDVFALLGSFHAIFVAKQEVVDWPLIGWLCQRVGTLFFRRGSGFAAMSLIVDKMVNTLQAGQKVFFFPEGTTTNGRQVQQFHARIFQAAVKAKVPVQPVALQYIDKEGKISGIAPYIDEDTLLSHLWRLFGETDLQIHIWFCDPITIEEKKRRTIAEEAYQQIVTALQQYNTESTDFQDLQTFSN